MYDLVQPFSYHFQFIFQIHVLNEIYREDRYDVSLRPRFSNATMWRWFLGTMAGFFTIFFILEDPKYKMGRPVVAKQYPGDGPHYSFSA